MSTLPLDDRTRELVKATAPILLEHGETITRCFYNRMLSKHPELKRYFNQTHQQSGAQAKALAYSVFCYANHINELDKLGGLVEQIVTKHVSLDILPEHYPIVGENLIAAIIEVLGDAFTPELQDAWVKAYGFLADLLIGLEEQEYAKHEAQTGGWRGLRDFDVVKIEDESSLIRSFYLRPSDEQPLMRFIPGQYIGIQTQVNGRVISRNYSLSDSPNQDYYRISVKKEGDGEFSNFLHQQVEVGHKLQLTAPTGAFTLTAGNAPVVLLTAGVGLTPAISMVNACVESGREVRFIHAAQNAQVHGFRTHIDDLAAKHTNLRRCYVYEQDDNATLPADYQGRVTQEILTAQLPEGEFELYILGPTGFMQQMLDYAKALNVPTNKVHYESFGPLQNLCPVAH